MATLGQSNIVSYTRQISIDCPESPYSCIRGRHFWSAGWLGSNHSSYLGKIHSRAQGTHRSWPIRRNVNLLCYCFQVRYARRTPTWTHNSTFTAFAKVAYSRYLTHTPTTNTKGPDGLLAASWMPLVRRPNSQTLVRTLCSGRYGGNRGVIWCGTPWVIDA